MAEVTVVEANLIKSYAVCLDLLDAGYVLADRVGTRIDQKPSELSTIGVLRNLPRKYFLKFIPRRQKRDFIGVIFFSDKEKNANNKNWVIDVYGKENLTIFKSLAQSFVDRFGVDVHVRLERIAAKPEFFPYDYVGY